MTERFRRNGSLGNAPERRVKILTQTRLSASCGGSDGTTNKHRTELFVVATAFGNALMGCGGKLMIDDPLD
jgi:hypothetical protein